MTSRELSRYIDITVAARLADLSPLTVRRYMQLGLIGSVLTTDQVADLRRVRRLASLGVNLVGVEIILRMRRRILELQAEIELLNAQAD